MGKTDFPSRAAGRIGLPQRWHKEVSLSRRTESSCNYMKRCVVFIPVLALLTGCHSVRHAQTPPASHFKIVTYNVNWGAPGPELAVEVLRQSGADIICLQETTPEWERVLRYELARDYSYADFRHAVTRMGGGLAFLSRLPMEEVAYVPSETGWFDGWIMELKTTVGSVQVLNVHLRPPISDSGSWISGYFSTSDDRLREMQRFYSQRKASLPTVVAGDFNDREDGAVIEWLQSQGMVNALPEFDRYTPTWRWRSGLFSLSRRMDHVVYSQGLRCCSARVVQAGASDHYPVEAVFAAPDAGH